MGFALGTKDLKLFLIVCGVIIVGFLMLLPPADWQWFWDYLNNTAPWVVLGQSWLLLAVGVVITFFLIILRELIR